ncbi:MAG: hypothetical protein ACTSRK_13690 [Promethearchaeota archaeon]
MAISTIHSQRPRGRIPFWGILALGVLLLGTAHYSGLRNGTEDPASFKTVRPLANADPTSFLSVWNTSCLSTGSSALNQIKLPLRLRNGIRRK